MLLKDASLINNPENSQKLIYSPWLPPSISQNPLLQTSGQLITMFLNRSKVTKLIACVFFCFSISEIQSYPKADTERNSP